uniref:Uncharacterized protein n=1 Tax=Clytia hemisphaerica TaxID=252671 RepID=A0A7M5XFX4_9CNID
MENKPPRLCLFATKTIEVYDEIQYFYGKFDQPWYHTQEMQQIEVEHNGENFPQMTKKDENQYPKIKSQMILNQHLKTQAEEEGLVHFDIIADDEKDLIDLTSDRDDMSDIFTPEIVSKMKEDVLKSEELQKDQESLQSEKLHNDDKSQKKELSKEGNSQKDEKLLNAKESPKHGESWKDEKLQHSQESPKNEGSSKEEKLQHGEESPKDEKLHKDDESPKEELPKDEESLKDDKSLKDKQLRTNEKPLEQKDLQKTDGSPKDDKLQKDEKLPNEEKFQKVEHKQELVEDSDDDRDEMFVLDKSDVWSNMHKDDEPPKEELPKDEESLKDDKSLKDKQLRKNEKPLEQKDLQKTDGSPKDDKLQKDEKLPNEEEFRKVEHKQELIENSDADSDEMFVLDKSDVWSNIHKDDESPKEELPKDKESLKDDKSSEDKQLRKNEKPLEQKDLQKTDGSPKDNKFQNNEKLPNEEKFRNVKHKQELTENSDADSDELFVLDKADVWSNNDTGNTRRSSRKRKKTISYKGMELEHDGLETFGDPDFIPFEDELQVDAVVNPDDALERAIAKMNELCAQFEKEDEYRASSPVDEMLIKNDSAIGLGSSIGEIIDTSADEQEISIREEEQDIGQIQDKNNENHERNIEKQRENDEKQGAGAEKQGAIAERKDDKDGKKKKKKKPKRPCPYGCVRKQSVLSRHLKLQHKDEPAIIQILAKPKELQNKLFDNLKKEGIFKYNQKEMLKDNPCYMRERRSKDSAKIITANDIVVCSECKGTYSKSFKARHQIECGKTGGKVMIPMIPVKDMIVTEYPADFKDVINKMKLDEISNWPKLTIYINRCARIFNGNKCKSEKMQEVETRVRSHMRLLSRLLLKFIESFGYSKQI